MQITTTIFYLTVATTEQTTAIILSNGFLNYITCGRAITESYTTKMHALFFFKFYHTKSGSSKLPSGMENLHLSVENNKFLTFH